MKKRILSIILTLSVMLGCMPLVLQEVNAEETGKKITDYSTGDTLEYGWYPQSKVTDEATVAQLDAVTKNWISYGYYSGSYNGDTGDEYDGSMAPSDYMKYCDITLDGNKYRAVTFSKYRKEYTGYTADTSTEDTYQAENGYYINNVYYFKYEPLKWVVLDAGTGLVVCDSAIDSQAYQNCISWNGSEYYNSKDCENYASDWETSSLRKWLNDDFLNTAFTSGQQSRIKVTERENKSNGSSTYDSNPTSDKITLLSYWDAVNTSYGFDQEATIGDPARQRKSTAYAQCQGCFTEASYSGNSYWWLRSSDNSGTALKVGFDCWAYFRYKINATFTGIVPAFNFDTNVEIVQKPVVKENIGDYETGDTLEYGWYPQSKVTDEATVTQLDAVTKNWISYGYYSGSDNGKMFYIDDGNMAPSDYMKYCDIMLDGNKYRAVTFSSYRKSLSGFTADTSENNTQQPTNGYYINNVYYFKYEPLKWVVLDASTGLVVCDSAIDSQAYNNYVLYSNSTYYGDSTKSHYASDWENSSLRAWLNDDFLNTAFTSGQQSKIKVTERENKSKYDSTYDSNPTSDKITLLSYWDVLDTSYGFSSSYNTNDTSRQRNSTDYAQCQGCYVVLSNKNSYWWLRSPRDSKSATEIDYDGWANSSSSTQQISNGIVPAFNFDTTSAIIQCTVTDIGYTNRTVTLNPNGGTINSGNVTEYDIGTGATLPTDVTKEGYAFGGWYDNENLTGDPITAISTTEKNNKEYWAKWIDNENPVISGIENGKTYCSAQTITVTDNGTIRSVTVNGNGVQLDNDGKFTLNPATGEQEIIVTDMDGNTATMKVTINDGHTGGTATCKDKAVCDYCGKPYGEPNSSNHAGGTEIRNAKDANCTEDGYTGDTYCKGCDAKLQDGKPVTKLGHTDANKDHICDVESCKATISACSGGTATCKDKAVCEYCGMPYGELNSSNHAGGTEVRNAKDAKCTEDGYTGDTYCKGCGTKLQDGNPITKTGHDYESKVTKEPTVTSTGTRTYTCKICGHSYEEEIAKLVCQHSGGTATCKDQAVCEHCGEKYGEVDPHNHAGELTWTIDGKAHEQKCEACGEIVVKNEKHSFLWGSCCDCGYVSNFRIVFCLCRAVWYIVQLFDSGIGYIAGWIASLF